MAAPRSIEAWLEALALDDLKETFLRNRIDLPVLPHLTQQDLAQLAPRIGQRRVLERAIAAMVAESSPGSPRTIRRGAERRHLTVLFCDLVGSTALSMRLDPEEMLDLLRGYQDACAGVITRFGGYVYQFVGDGVVAYFGWPRAHENDAERAISAGLEIIETIRGLELRGHGDLAFAARVGIASGDVVVERSAYPESAYEAAISGSAPNLASRLQDLAKPHSVVIGAETHALAGSLFECRDLGAHAIKGFSEPVAAWLVVASRPTETRFEATHQTRLTKLVGRHEEIEYCLQRWKRAQRGEGRVLVLSGEAGVGKSRIVHVLKERVGLERHPPVLLQCSPLHGNVALQPVLASVERACGFRRTDDAETRLDKLEHSLERLLGESQPLASLLADLLGVDAASRYAPLGLAAPRRKELMLESLTGAVSQLTRRAPVLIVVEDVHWSDPTTLTLIDRVVERAADLALFLVLTCRPEFEPRWKGRHVDERTVARLSPGDCAALAEHAAGGRVLPDQIAAAIVERADGIPLFVEELTTAVLESGALQVEGGRYHLSTPLEQIAIPATLHDSLTERLDRLGVAKEVAKLGATIGRDFSHELLAGASSLEPIELQRSLDRLEHAGLLYRSGTPPDARYTFKHALVRDAAYNSMLRGSRKKLHRRIAGALEQGRPEIVEEQPETLAHHLGEAGEVLRAARLWNEAGRRALASADYEEAIDRLGRGLELLEQIPPDLERRLAEVRLLESLGMAYYSTRGYAHESVESTFARVEAICNELGNDIPLQTLYGLWSVRITRGAVDETATLVERFSALAAQSEDPLAPLYAHGCRGVRMALLGDFERADRELGRSTQACERFASSVHLQRLPYGGAVYPPGWWAWVLCMRGEVERARAVERRMRALAATLDNPYGHALAGHFSALVAAELLEIDAALELAQRQVEFSAAQGILIWQMNSRCIRGWARAHRGEPLEGAREIEDSLGTLSLIGMRSANSTLLAFRADAQLQAGQLDPAMASVAEGLALAESSLDRFYRGRLKQIRASIQLARGDVGGATKSLRDAIEVSRASGARWHELQAAIDLARLLADSEERTDAARVLRPVYDTFESGFETAPLRAARALLDALA